MWVGPAQARGPEPRALRPDGAIRDQRGVRAEDFPYIGDSLDQDIYRRWPSASPAMWLRTEHASADDKAPDGVPTVSRLADALPHLIAG